MNKYQVLFETSDYSTIDVKSELNTLSTWEDAYWLSKIALSSDCGLTDEQIIELLEDCLFLGLSVIHKDAFFDVNEHLIKLYIRYSRYEDAASRLIVLVSNYSCPDWVHLYLAMSQLHLDTKQRIVEDPHFFFNRLLSVDLSNEESSQEVRNIFSKYLYMIMDQFADNVNVASGSIIHFAEEIGFTDSEDFRLFHKTICPEFEYKKVNSTEVFDTKANVWLEEKAELEARLAEEKKNHESTQNSLLEAKGIIDSIQVRYELEQAKNEEIEGQLQQTENEKQSALAHLQQEKYAHESTKELLEKELNDKRIVVAELESTKTENEKLAEEKTKLAIRLKELEKAKQTAMQPESIDDIWATMSGWLNVKIRRYLAQWLTNSLERNCKENYWNVNVKNAVSQKERERFDTYKELSDFAIDALLNIYLYNINLFYDHDSKAKVDAKECIKEMKQVRNRWVGHFEENSWTKEKILFDIETITEFVSQIGMEPGKQKEYRDFKQAVSRMS